MRTNIAILLAVATLVVGAAGGFFWQNRAVSTLAGERDSVIVEMNTLKAKASALEKQNETLTAENTRLKKDLESATYDRNALTEAVQINTSAHDLAVAYGQARISRNEPWIRALMTSQLAASYQFPVLGDDQLPTRYAIVRETKGSTTWTYAIRVWISYKAQGEIGYIDDTVTVIKEGSYYKIQSLSHANYISLQPGK